MGVEALQHYRLRWAEWSGPIKGEKACGWRYDDSTDEMTDFGGVSATSSRIAGWAQWLAAAVEAAEQQVA